MHPLAKRDLKDWSIQRMSLLFTHVKPNTNLCRKYLSRNIKSNNPDNTPDTLGIPKIV